MNLNDIAAKALDLWASEPVAIVALVTGIIDLAIAFGAPIDDAQKSAAIGLVSAIGVVIARGQVTPVAKL